MINYSQLMELDRLARADGARYPNRRELYTSLLQEKGRHAIGIVGPRGAGKTVLLKQLAIEIDNSFYLSVDTIGPDEDLFSVAGNLKEKLGMEVLLLDEIHAHRMYQEALKKIFDFLKLRVIFTSSVSLSLFESTVDLSRRVRLVYLFPFSFREFIRFSADIDIPRLSIADIIAGKWTSMHLRQSDLFDKYLHGGLMPFALEEPDVFPLLENIVQKVLASDIPSVMPIMTDELPLIKKCIEFIGRSEVDGINFTSLSRNIGITRYKAEAYVKLLEKAFILNVVYPRGTNVLKEPKILMCLPYRLLYSHYDTAIGGLREDFFIEMMRMTGIPVNYLKSTRGTKTPDYIIASDGSEVIVEIGGKNKGREQFKGVPGSPGLILSHSLETRGIRRPLFMAGYL